MDVRSLEQEKQLVARAQRDPEAFGLLYEQNYDAIFNYVLRRTGHVETAQDIVSETFFVALRSLGKFKWQGVPFSAWLYRIAINEMAGYFRRARVGTVSLEAMHEEGFEPPSDSDVEREALAWQEEIDRHLEYHAVRQAVDALPEHYQEVVALRFFAGKQIADIGVVLGKPQGTVKSLLHRGLEKLRQTLTQARYRATFGETSTYVEKGRGAHGQ
ncbi:MAG: RNA polymerase sigma factor YlaC [Firmicutes bacterium]|nr:RNA polymerase sigma factor YlaC [candidate division NPL-UPA2 bacterium]